MAFTTLGIGRGMKSDESDGLMKVLISAQRWNNWMILGILLIFLGILIVMVVALLKWDFNRSDQKSSPYHCKERDIHHRNRPKRLEDDQYLLRDIEPNSEVL